VAKNVSRCLNGSWKKALYIGEEIHIVTKEARVNSQERVAVSEIG